MRLITSSRSIFTSIFFLVIILLISSIQSYRYDFPEQDLQAALRPYSNFGKRSGFYTLNKHFNYRTWKRPDASWSITD
ncbi:unnamed protein product, partial [Mesorhabditis belari]|uniref:Uncharacterized protein n=1 Tax=Mesorhabditis belari TaxID=2138241 RepID=A0AAF3EIF5_9BILA